MELKKKSNEVKAEVCGRCKSLVAYDKKDIRWDESGYGYSTKFIICPHCKTPIILEYREDNWMKGRNY